MRKMSLNRKKAIRAWIVVLVVGLASLFVSPFVQAKMSESEMYYYGTNRIYYYNPYGRLWGSYEYCDDNENNNTRAVDSTDIAISGNDNASEIMGMLINNGYSKESAAAILGNLYAESRLNPMLIQGGEVVTEDFRAWNNGQKTYVGGFGLVQWDYYTRVQALQNYADSHGWPVASVKAQIGFMIEELASYGYGPSVLNGMNIEDATYAIWRNYENPATQDYEVRLGYAKQFLGVETGGLPEKAEAGGNGSDENVNCVVGEYPGGIYTGEGTPVNTDGIVAFLQCDPAWGSLNYGAQGINGGDGNTICAAGCGPTSFASIAATMGISTNPAETADIAGRAGMYVHGAGSSWAITSTLASHYGLQYEPLGDYSVEYINTQLRSGGMIHVAGRGGMPYSSGGHYIAIIGISDSGQWIVTDSGHSAEYAIATYDPHQIVAGMNVGSAGVVRR